MAVYNLDINEEIDYIKINWIDYEIWDIPVKIIEKVMTIKTWLFRKDIIEQWRPICQEILELRNKNIDLSNITKEKLFAFIGFIQWKIQKWQIW
jgi:hypothetical protein